MPAASSGRLPDPCRCCCRRCRPAEPSPGLVPYSSLLCAAVGGPATRSCCCGGGCKPGGRGAGAGGRAQVQRGVSALRQHASPAHGSALHRSAPLPVPASLSCSCLTSSLARAPCPQSSPAAGAAAVPAAAGQDRQRPLTPSPPVGPRPNIGCSACSSCCCCCCSWPLLPAAGAAAITGGSGGGASGAASHSASPPPWPFMVSNRLRGWSGQNSSCGRCS